MIRFVLALLAFAPLGTGVQSAAAQPTAAQPAAPQPTAAQPAAAQPTAAQPTAAQPTTAQPNAAQPTAAQPTAAQPTGGQPVAVLSAAALPRFAPASVAGSALHASPAGAELQLELAPDHAPPLPRVLPRETRWLTTLGAAFLVAGASLVPVSRSGCDYVSARAERRFVCSTASVAEVGGALLVAGALQLSFGGLQEERAPRRARRVLFHGLTSLLVAGSAASALLLANLGPLMCNS